MKTALLLLIAITCIASVRADQERKDVLLLSADILFRLESTRSEILSVPPTNESLKRYEVELQKSAEEFITLANRAQAIDPALGKKTYECGMALVDSAFAIFKGFEAQAAPEKIVQVHTKHLGKFPTAYRAFLTAFGSLNGDGAVITTEEQAAVGREVTERLKKLSDSGLKSPLGDAARELEATVGANGKRAQL